MFLSDLVESAREIGERWPNQAHLRSVALELADFEHWGHQFYPEFEAAILRDRSRITGFAISPNDACSLADDMRVCALRALAYEWPDEPTREFLNARALKDENGGPRAKALELLAGDERWADEHTRQLLSQRAVNDEDSLLRAKVLELLAGDERWADHKETIAARNQFIADIAGAESREQRGEIACVWFGTAESSDPLSDAKKLVFSRDVDGVGPCLDPREPVSDEHLGQVAETANLDDEQLAEMVEQMNDTLGWDIRKGWPGPTDNER